MSGLGRLPQGSSTSARLEKYTDRTSSDCWLWTGAVDRTTGYGRMQVNGSTGYAHRVAYEEYVGPIPDNKQIDHLCRVRRCCNPQHLEAVTPKINTLRGNSTGARARRRQFCLYGLHDYATHGREYQGKRSCRECNRISCMIYRSMTREERQARKDAGLPVIDLAGYYRRMGQVAA